MNALFSNVIIEGDPGRFRGIRRRVLSDDTDLVIKREMQHHFSVDTARCIRAVYSDLSVTFDARVVHVQNLE